MLFILLVGAVPAIVLIIHIYSLDRIEKEPVGFLIRLFLLGGISTVAAALCENLGEALLGMLVYDKNSRTYLLLFNFVVIALVEEGWKYLILKRRTWNSPYFNYRFDAIVYAASVSLGFAAFENVLYVVEFGAYIAPIRAVTAIPLHCIAGIYMGHFYGQAKFLTQRGMQGRAAACKALSLIVPVFLHGFYDYCADTGNDEMTWIFVAYIVLLDIVAFISLRDYAREDTYLD